VVPKLKRESGRLKATSARNPKRPVSQATRRRVITVRASFTSSAPAAASATWRTPELPIPSPVRVPTRVMSWVKSPKRPTPLGPSRSATALVRTMPIRMLAKDAAPISEEDFRISRKRPVADAVPVAAR